MKLKDVPIGSRVKWKGWEATVFSHDHPDIPGNTMLVWKDGEKAFGAAWPTSSWSKEFPTLTKDYAKGYWVAFDNEAELLSAVSTQAVAHSSGMFCSRCRDFNEYAQPNRGAEFVCYSCRR